MDVVDIRNLFSTRNVEIIEANNEVIYYTEEKMQSGKSNLFLIKYNYKTNSEKILTSYSLDNLTFIQHFFSTESSIVIILENGESYAWVIKIDKTTGEETLCTKIHCIGKFSNCIPLTDSQFLIYTSQSSEFFNIFNQHKTLTSCKYMCYLYDIEKNKKYFVKSTLLSKLKPEQMKFFYGSGGEKKAVILDQFGNDELKEYYFKESRWISEDIRDNLWIYSVNDMINDIVLGSEPNIKNIASADIKGLVRFCGMDDNNIYFRTRLFAFNNIEKVCAFNKDSQIISVVCEYNINDDKDSRLLIDYNSCKVYKISGGVDALSIRGVFNSKLDVLYEEKPDEHLIGCIEDRFIITQGTISDAKDNSTYKYTAIFDCKEKAEETFECKCFFNKNTLVLY